MRIVGLSVGDPAIARTASGVAMFLFDAIERREQLVGRRAVDLSRRQRLAVAAATFHPDRDRWKSRFHWSRRLAIRLRSRNSRRALVEMGQPVDLVLQIFGMFQTRGAPYVIYVDNTAELSRRHWPEWVEVEGRALERLYAWERTLYGNAGHVFTMGSTAARSVIDFYGVPEKRVTTVGGGVNFETLPSVAEGAREPIALFVGRDWDRKGGDRLIEAFRDVKRRVPEARLQIVGTDRAPTSEPGVEVLGTVDDREQIAELYASAAVFCLPSVFEPYGLAIAEAMAYGLACVVTRVGAMDEVVEDGGTGLVVPPADVDALSDALAALLGDPARAGRMGMAGRLRVERELNWDAVVQRMEPGLRSAIA